MTFIDVTPQSQIDRARAIAQGIGQQALQVRPIASPLQGLAQIAQAGLAGLLMSRADRQEEERRKAGQQALAGLARPGAATDVPALLQIAGNFPELSGTVNPLVSSALQPRPGLVADPTQLGFRQGTVLQQGPEGFKVLQEPSESDVVSPEREAQLMRLAEARRSNVTVEVDTAGNPLPDLPSGFAYARDEAGDPIMQEDPDNPGVFTPVAVPIPGTKEAETRKKTAEREKTRADSEAKKAGGLLDLVGRARGLVTERAPFSPVTGFAGSIAAAVPGTPAHDLSNLLDTIKANIGFNRLQEMREASPTGGALGQVTERELARLEAVVASLSQSQSEEQFLENLAIVEQTFADVIHGPQQGTVTQSDVLNMSDDELMRSLGL